MSKDFSIRPLTVGAEIVGLAPDRVNDPDVQKALYAAWLAHGLLLFKNVESYAHHLALSRCFGELELHPVIEARHKDEPLFVEIGGSKNYTFVYDDNDIISNRIPWHRDTAFTPFVCKGAMLRMLVTPPREGDTWFSDTATAYDDLPPEVKTKLDTLEYKATLNTGGDLQNNHPGTWWRKVRPPTKDEYFDPNALDYSGAAARQPSVVLPALLVHPESGRKCIYLSPSYVEYFIGMDRAESDRLLRFLTDHMLQPKYVYEHKWDVNDAVIWDNRRLMHAAPGHRAGENRYGLRTTLAEKFQIGRYFDQNAKAGLAVVD
jgi:taurine dioxygenase